MCLLKKAQGSSRLGGIVRVKHPCEGLGSDVADHRADDRVGRGHRQAGDLDGRAVDGDAAAARVDLQRSAFDDRRGVTAGPPDDCPQPRQQLALAEGTVKNHVSNILSKLGARDRTQAVLSALELGLL